MKRASTLPGSAAHTVIEEAVAAWAKELTRVGGATIPTRSWMAPYVARGVKERTLRDRLNNASIGSGKRGRPSLFAESTQQVALDAAASADRGNKGISRKTAIQSFLDMTPGRTQAQARNHWYNTAKPKGVAAGVIKKSLVSPAPPSILTQPCTPSTPNLHYTRTRAHTACCPRLLQVKPQATTSMRSMVNPRQQRRWHAAVDLARKKLQARNLPDGTGVPYDSVESCFVVNFDEECLMSSDGVVSVIGSANGKKHEKEIAGRTSITFTKVIGADGAVGPVFALMAGKTAKKGFTSELMMRYGAPAGSMILMTPTGFMTDETFDAMARNLAEGIRAMPVIKEHPTWWVLLTGDGFHSHKMTLRAQVVLFEYKIMLLIEEGDSSQTNQAFDKHVAKYGKSNMREALDVVVRHSTLGIAVDQWGLLMIGLHGIRELIKNPEIIRSSFESVNMLFCKRVGVDQWLDRIKDALDRGSKFQDEGEITPRMLLPDWYRQWPSDRVQGALDIVANGDGWGDVAMIQRLLAFTGLSPAELQSYQTCWFVETDDPDLGGEVAAPQAPPPRSIEYNPNEGLLSYTLKPPGLKGEALLAHMAQHRSWDTNPMKRNYDTAFVDYLDLEISQRIVHRNSRVHAVSDQLKAIMPTERDLMQGSILKEIGTHSASKMMPRRMLNGIGEVNAYCVEANSEERIKKLRANLELADSLEAIKEIGARATKEKADEKLDSMKECAPKGIAKLQIDEADVGLCSTAPAIPASPSCCCLRFCRTCSPC